MPFAAPRLCPRCSSLVTGGQCPICARPRDRRPRGTDTARGYGWLWKHFLMRLRHALIEAGIAPVCGAALPGGPDTARWSRCAQEGRLTGDRLQGDHEPPLTEAERAAARSGDRRAVDDLRRVGFLCITCHEAKTRAQAGTRM